MRCGNYSWNQHLYWIQTQCTWLTKENIQCDLVDCYTYYYPNGPNSYSMDTIYYNWIIKHIVLNQDSWSLLHRCDLKLLLHQSRVKQRHLLKNRLHRRLLEKNQKYSALKYRTGIQKWNSVSQKTIILVVFWVLLPQKRQHSLFTIHCKI